MDDSKLVVACHCMKHPQMFVVNPGGRKGRKLSDEVTYVDPQCEGNTWDVIPSQSKFYIWGENCSVYGELTFGTFIGGDAQLLNILTSSYRILESGGVVIFPYSRHMIRDKNLDKAREHPDIKGKYTLWVVDSEPFPINLAHVSNISKRFEVSDTLIIFRKIDREGGGKSRKPKTRRAKPYQKSKSRLQ